MRKASGDLRAGWRCPSLRLSDWSLFKFAALLQLCACLFSERDFTASTGR